MRWKFLLKRIQKKSKWMRNSCAANKTAWMVLILTITMSLAPSPTQTQNFQNSPLKKCSTAKIFRFAITNRSIFITRSSTLGKYSPVNWKWSLIRTQRKISRLLQSMRNQDLVWWVTVLCILMPSLMLLLLSTTHLILRLLSSCKRICLLLESRTVR